MIHQPEVRTELAPHAHHRGARRESVDGDARERRDLRGPRHEIAQYGGDIGATVRTHADQSGGWNHPVGRIDDDAHRGDGELVLGGHARHHVRFHIDRGGAGQFIKLALFCRLGDRLVDAEDRRMDGARDQAEELARPHRIRGADRLRFADGGSDDPISGAQMGGEAAGDAEADHAKMCIRDSGKDPILWDFGSAAVHHRLYSPWLKPENCKAGLVGLRGTVDPAFGLMKHHAEEMASILKAAGVAKMPVGVDIIEPPMRCV